MKLGRYAELNTIDITVTSPQKLVTVRLTRKERVKVSFDPNRRRVHDEESAAEEVEQAVMKAWNEYAIQSDKIRQKWTDRILEPIADENQLPAWQRNLHDELDGIEVDGLSANRLVSAIAYGDGDVVIIFQNNAIRRTDVSEQQLGEEASEAIDLAKLRQAKRTVEIYDRFMPEIKNDWETRLRLWRPIMAHTYDSWSTMIKELSQEVMEKALEVREKTWNSSYKEGPEDLYLISDVDDITGQVDNLIDNWPWPFDMDPIIQELSRIAPPIPDFSDNELNLDYLSGGMLKGDAFVDVPSAVRALDGWQSPSTNGEIAASDQFKDNFLTVIPETANRQTLLISQLSSFAKGYRDLYLSAYRDLEYTLREAIKRLDELIATAEAAAIANGYAVAEFAIKTLTGGGFGEVVSFVVGGVGRAESRTDIGKWVDVLKWVDMRLNDIPTKLVDQESEFISHINKVTGHIRSVRTSLVLDRPSIEGFEPVSAD